VGQDQDYGEEDEEEDEEEEEDGSETDEKMSISDFSNDDDFIKIKPSPSKKEDPLIYFENRMLNSKHQ
jgi:hypothetical protein